MSRLLIAGIGNIFFGDDAFGVEVVRRLADRFDPATVRVVDFGTRGFDLALALTEGYEGAILIDAVRHGGPPGTLYVIEPDVPSAGAVEGHGLHPAKVLALARTLGDVCPWLRLVGCEPLTVGTDEGLSEPARAAVPEAVRLIETLVAQFPG